MKSGIHVFFYALVGLFFILKWTELKQIKIAITSAKLRSVGIGTLITCAILLVRVLCAPEDIWSKGAFLATFLVGCAFLSRLISWPVYAIQVWLLCWTVLCTYTLNYGLSVVALSFVLVGLLVYKLLEYFLFTAENSLDDILPSCVWLSALAWASLTGRNEANVGNILFVCLSISLILRWLPGNFIADDKYFIKRIVLSVCAGLSLLIILNTVLLQPNMILPALFALGIFFSYFFASQFSDDDIKNLLQSTNFLISLGILTLLATRLAGDIGLVVMSAACCINAGKGMFAALFWNSRLLIQGFVLSNVANVTGINLMHPYCSAALFFGFLVILFLSLIQHINSKRQVFLAALLSIGLLVPPVILYFIHEEAGASFLIAANVVAISLISFSALLYKELDANKQNNLMIMPLFLSAVAVLCAPLIEIGNHATVSSRLQIVSYCAVVALVIYFILLYFNRGSRKSIAVSGNQN